MTEAVVNIVVGKLNELINKEANLLLGVDEQVRLLQHELEWMLVFIQDADVKRRSDPRVKLWVRQLRDISFHAEDVIDEFLVKIDRRRRSSVWFTGKLKCVYRLPILHDLGSQIQVINTMTKTIAANRSNYCLESVQIGGESIPVRSFSDEAKSLRDIRNASMFDDESDVVGLDKEREEVKSLLIDREVRYAVISVVGMGGLGKTTLAKKVFNDTKRYFDCCAWVSVSQAYYTKEILRGIIKCFSLYADDKETEEDMRTKLREYLASNKKYLIVLDDIWDVEAWDILSTAFPNQGNGSRVMLTTRNKDVALHACRQRATSHADLHKNIRALRFLDESESWELFLKKIFPERHGANHQEATECPADLEELGRKMVAQCGGLPLAIVVLGGLLACKDKTPTMWSKVNDSVSWQLSHIGGSFNSCMGILALSYYDLPYYLKPVFLYFGLFPEDHEISVTKLIQYWVAEGLISERGKEILTDIAEDYLEVLVDKSLIQVTRRTPDGRAKLCRIHDLLRDLSITEAENDKFLHLYGSIDLRNPTNNVRRLTIHGNDFDRDEDKRISEKVSSNQHLRSLMCFTSNEKQESWSFRVGVRLLTVIELGGLSVRHLPKEIGQLIHLKYLGLRNIGARTIPDSIGKLVNLQTFDVRDVNSLRDEPNVVWSLYQLRHLYISGSLMPIDKNEKKWFRKQLPLGVDNLTYLQTLVAPAGNWLEGGGLGQLRSLRKLIITRSLTSYKDVISDCIAKLDGLRSLQLRRSEEIPTFLPFSRFKNLYKLRLEGALQKLPQEMTFFPPNLNKLNLTKSRLESDPMAVLERLPNLKVLKLGSDSYLGKKMVCSNGGFIRLQVLKFYGLKFEEWSLDTGALRNLRELVIVQCGKLKMIPDGLREVTMLQSLKMQHISNELKARVEENGDDWEKIRHIQSRII